MPGSTKFVRQHFYETVEHKATSRQLSAVPHQAPQRERVSLVVRGSVLLQSTGDALKTDTSWKRKIKGNNVESVPRLLWLLEPKIVFAHAKASCRGQYAESQYCQGMFFEGYHRGGGRAHGVYEGTYWDLLANIGELTEALTQMAVGPTVLEEPVLQLPPPPVLPSWDSFKPVLQPLPPLPQLLEVAVRLPPFKPPKVATVEYDPPQLLPLPELLDEEEETVPGLVLPDGLKPKGLGVQPDEVPFDPPLTPNYPLQPAPPPYDKPQYGADWTGLKPFQEAEPVMAANAVLPVVIWQYPPATLPKPPHGDLSRPSDSSAASLARMIGGLALAGSSAAITDKPTARPALVAASRRPTDLLAAAQLGPSADAAERQELPLLQTGTADGSTSTGPDGDAATGTDGESATVASASSQSAYGSGGDGWGARSRAEQGGTGGPAADPAGSSADAQAAQRSSGSINGNAAAGVAPAGAESGGHQAPHSISGGPAGSSSSNNDGMNGRGGSSVPGTSANAGSPTSAAAAAGGQSSLNQPSSIAAYRPGGDNAGPGASGGSSGAQEGDKSAGQDQAQYSGRDRGTVGGSSRAGLEGVASGTASGTELPPRPVQEPAPDFVQPFQEPLPPRDPLTFHPLPVFEHPPFQAPAFAPPCAPRPIGFLAGYTPLLLLDMSGTMHPSKGGRFFEMKACAMELLKPTGELAAVAAGFDVIAFSSAPTSWAACYEGHLALLEGSSKPLVGRQNGRRAYRPNSASTGCMRLQKGQSTKSVPAEPALLAEASHWVDRWQEPTGHTNYDAALQMAERYLEADCEYIFSDGLSDYAVVLLEKLRTRVMQGERVPVIHTVGFFAEEQRGGPGERFLRQLSALTGGTFQEYRPEVWRVWSNGEWLEYDLKGESEAVKAERMWSEAALQAQRRNNARLCLEESFVDLMARLPRLHAQRVAAEAAAYEQEAATLRAAHEAECAIVRKLNADIQRRSDEEYYRMTEPLRTHNEVLMAAAAQQHEVAVKQCQREYSLAVMEWESLQEALPATQQQPRCKAKLPRLATLQPEDSAEQLSNSAMPARQTAAAAAASRQSKADGQAARDSPASTSRSGLASEQPAQRVPGAPGPAAAPQQAANRVSQPGEPSPRQDQAGLTNGQAEVGERFSLQPDAVDAAAGEQRSAGSMLTQPVRQLSNRLVLSGDSQGQLLASEFGPQQAQQDGSGAQQTQQEGLDAHQAQQAKQEDSDFGRDRDSAQAEASTNLSSASHQKQHGESVYAARDLTVLEQYEADVVEAYASSFVAEAMMQQMLPATANAVTAEQHQTALAEVQRRNALNKQRHLEEVKAERAAWEEHEANIKRWKATKAELEAGYASELAEAKATHQQHVARLRRQWEKEQKVLQAEYNRRVGIERGQHEIVCEPIRQRNAERHEVAARRREQRRHIEKANDDLVVAAEQLHQQKLYEAQAVLSTQLVVARQQHADVCMQLQKEHAALQQAVLQEHALQKAVIARWNDEATLQARGRYGAEINRLQKGHAHHCGTVQAQHDVVCEQVCKHNDAIWPQVSVAQAAQGELDRVGRFIEHIRACAEKMEVGVNYVPETPNLDRVVEMSALTEALHKAFPDLTPDQYPWPNNQEEGGGAGRVKGSWPAPPKTRNSASAAQQALDRIRQAALPSRPQSALRMRNDGAEQQVTSVSQVWQNSSTQAIAYASTTHTAVSYRPLTSSSRPSTAHFSSPRASHPSPRPRPASALDRPTRLASGHALAERPTSLSAAVAASHVDGGHLHITQLVQSKGVQQSGQRSVSPLSGGSTGATPSPAQTPCSVLSRPSTAGHRRGYQPARKAFDAAEISNCLQRHKLASMYSLR